MLQQRRAAQGPGLAKAPASVPGSGSWGWCVKPAPRKSLNFDAFPGQTAHHLNLMNKSSSTGTLKIHETRREAERVLGAHFDRMDPQTPQSETSSQGARRRSKKYQEKGSCRLHATRC